ncbi:MarR family winged helix-turn-helix transcriptional regulator [Streptomyces sp. CC208A]|uniref:MarR family winged helix-turn-helix transcriptional regulator n=1 Tax=Streptomyces sp. CC208A TaxID=3044573 RepID=UPI0024A82E73|nr:MarR family winged helix-turn-helix transcriptional regulator [Streptomyces sp. CC208A]
MTGGQGQQEVRDVREDQGDAVGERDTGDVGLHRFAVALRRTFGEVNRVAHGFAADQRLHPTDVQALSFVLDHEGPVTPGLLRNHLGLTSGAVTACLDRLEKAGHIRRTRESADRRVVHVEYADGAKAVARAHFRPLAEATEKARARFDEGELGTVLRFLEVLNAELADLRVPRR